MDIVQAITVIISLADNILSKLPDYDQTKKNQFYKIKKLYEQEMVKPYEEQDDDVVLNLRDELLRFGGAFSEEISGKESKTS